MSYIPCHLFLQDNDLFIWYPDFDECSTAVEYCDHICINTLGSYKCDCLDGYSLNAVTAICDGLYLTILNLKFQMQSASVISFIGKFMTFCPNTLTYCVTIYILICCYVKLLWALTRIPFVADLSCSSVNFGPAHRDYSY